MATEQKGSSGIGVLGLLLVIFVSAKLFNIEPVAAWSWWAVLWPLWVSCALTFVIFLVAIAVVLMEPRR